MVQEAKRPSLEKTGDRGIYWPQTPYLLDSNSIEMDYFQKFSIFQDFEISPTDNDLRVFHKIVEKCRHLGIMFPMGLSQFHLAV